MLILDTSAVSAVMHRVPTAIHRIQTIEPWSIILCSPVAAEIHYGLANLVASSRRRVLLEQEYRLIRDVVQWVDWSEEAAVVFGEIKAKLRKAGAPIDDFDIAISSIALILGAKVATHNIRHFEKVQGLSLEDWSF